MKTRLGARTGKKTLEEESKSHPNTEEHSGSKSQFGTFGVSNNTSGVPNGKAYSFQSFRKRMRSDSHPNHPCLFFRVF